MWTSVIEDFLDPPTTCASLGLCAAGAAAADEPDDVVAEGASSASVCKACKVVTRMIALKVFENPAASDKVAAKLLKICDAVPNASAAVKSQCASEIQEDTGAVMKELGESLRLHMCEDAKLCTV